MLIILTVMAIFGWGWRIGGFPMGWVGVVGVIVYLVVWNLNRRGAERQAARALAAYHHEATREGMAGAPEGERTSVPKAQGLISGLFENIGRWEGVAEAYPE